MHHHIRLYTLYQRFWIKNVSYFRFCDVGGVHLQVEQKPIQVIY